MFAKNCGMQSLLVLSGISSVDDVEQAPNTSEAVDSRPDFYAENLAELGKFIVGN